MIKEVNGSFDEEFLFRKPLEAGWHNDDPKPMVSRLLNR